jgi:hypothetical protein
MDQAQIKGDRRPTYVQTMDRQWREDSAELVAMHNGLWELRKYLTSEKFAKERSVNDVLLRMDEAVSAGLNARAEVA